MSIADHRTAINEALDAEVGMAALRSKNRMVQHIGLWGVWWGSPDSSAPDGMKVLLTSVRADAAGALPANRVPLRDLPWEVLQLQSLAPSDPIWDAACRVLQSDIEEHSRQAGASTQCTGRITYNPSQDVHNFRTVAQPDVLQGYSIERVDGPTAGDDGPASLPMRTRVPYRVFRGVAGDMRSQPLRVYLERPLPRKQQVGQRLQTESGFARTGDLMSAVGEWKTAMRRSAPTAACVRGLCWTPPRSSANVRAAHFCF